MFYVTCFLAVAGASDAILNVDWVNLTKTILTSTMQYITQINVLSQYEYIEKE